MRVYDAATRQQIGNLVDITIEGAMIVSDEIIPKGTNLRLRMELTDDVADKPYMEFSVLSTWHKPDVDPHRYNNGFEIIDLPEEDAQIIQRIVGIYGFRDNKIEK
jgi:hypothetical protein